MRSLVRWPPRHHGVDEPGGQRAAGLARRRVDAAARVCRRRRRALPLRRLLVAAASAVPDAVRPPHLSTVRRPAVRRRRPAGPLSRQRGRLRRPHPSHRESMLAVHTAPTSSCVVSGGVNWLYCSTVNIYLLQACMRPCTPFTDG